MLVEHKKSDVIVDVRGEEVGGAGKKNTEIILHQSMQHDQILRSLGLEYLV